MRPLQIAATALLAITATIVTCTAASADPTRDTTIVAPITAGGTDHGVTYAMRRAGTDISLDITGGTIHSDSHDITVTAADGTRIAALPVELNSGTHQVKIANRINGTHLTASIDARDIGYWELTSPRQRSIGAGIAIGGIIGVLGGLFIGLALGILTGGLLVPITLPVGLFGGLIGGMIVGGAAGASIPNSDVPDQWQYQQECHYNYTYDYNYCW